MSRLLPALLVLALLLAWVRYSGGIGGELPGVGEPLQPSGVSLDRGTFEDRAEPVLFADQLEEKRVSTLPKRLRPPLLDGEATAGARAGEGTPPKPGAHEEPVEIAPDFEPPEPLDGPVLRAHYPNGQLEFLCGQVLAEDGSWVREGDWEAWHENGQLHELGAYRSGSEHGEWQWWYEDGRAMAVGSFVEGQRHGRWTWWHANGQLMMEGSYERGLRVGTWRAFETDGTSGVATAEESESGR